MNSAYLHLVLNHFPIVGTVIGLLILLIGLFMNNKVMARTALGVLIFASIAAIPTFLTGESAEDLVEKIAGINENQIESHEDDAAIFAWAMGILGIVSLTTLILDRKGNALARMFYLLAAGVAIGTIIFAGQVGTSGGEIRHTELSTLSEPEIGNVLDGKENTPKEDDGLDKDEPQDHEDDED